MNTKTKYMILFISIAAILTTACYSFPSSPENTKADADVEFVRAVKEQNGTWTFSVTIRHPDTGWEDYTNGWDVLTPDGVVLKVNPNGHEVV